MTTFIRRHLLLIGIFVLALLLRGINLGNVPYGFDRDEIANAYVGRFILENGRDLYGNPFPVWYFDKFGDYPPVLPMYLSGAATYLFGLTPLAARLPAAVAGSLIVWPLFALASAWFSRRTGYLAALFIAVLPWHISLSRAGAEGILALTACVSGLALVCTASRRRYRWTGFLLLALPYLLYPSFRLVIPLLVLPFPWLQRPSRRTAWLPVVAAVFLTLSIAATPWGQGRFDQTSLFTNATDRSVIQNDLLQQIYAAPNQPVLLVRIFHNKYVAYLQRLVEQYVSYYTPEFWFIKGGYPLRYAVPHSGLAFFWMGILALLAVCFRSPGSLTLPLRYVLYLLAVAALPAAVTVDDWPNIHRSLLLMIPFVMLAASGADRLFRRIGSTRTRTIARTALILLVIGETVYGLRQYFLYAGAYYAEHRNDGHVQAARYLLDQRAHYPRIIATGKRWLSVYYLWYDRNFDPALAGAFTRDFTIPAIGQVVFSDSDCPSHELLHQVQEAPDGTSWLILDQAKCTVLPEFMQVGTVNTRGGTGAFTAVRLRAPAQ